ncbi:CATRA conflict system CASPASE/TPR repeat-associated protein [Streptomyces coerulescens]|uniref:CATRA conflict system CASPASE/TPR repeat-associated protein n=1 Tax=Streptomyces coerulescens TaxID=29304 RepID=A0ABW0CUE7_STRCD
MLQAEALGVHLFFVTGGERQEDALALLRETWERCGTVLGMTEPVGRVGVGIRPEGGWEALADGTGTGTGAGTGAAGLLAARGRPGPGLRQAALRREHDVLCLSVMLAPDAAEGLGWAELDALWSAALPGGATTERPGSGLLGSARLYLARPAASDERPSPDPDGWLTEAVRTRVPADPTAPDAWADAGTAVRQGFAVWEASAARDTRAARRLVVIAARDRDPELTAWTWTTRARGLPPFARYLLHAAKIRYQLRVRDAAGGIGRLRADTDTAITRLLALTADPHGPSRRSDLLRASHVLVGLQTRERGLVDRSTRIREMGRTVEIAAANLAALCQDPATGGPFADDRALAEWFVQRLDDEATYLEAALRRAEQVGALADQSLQRTLQRRQETVNLGLTGAIGAILMSLAAVQSLQYTVPLPGPVKPAVVTALGALALVASLVVLRAVAPGRRWSLTLLRLGVAALGAALGWTAAAAGGGAPSPGWTWLCAAAGAATALGIAVTATNRGDPRQ